jgi:hypothetical protein
MDLYRIYQPLNEKKNLAGLLENAPRTWSCLPQRLLDRLVRCVLEDETVQVLKERQRLQPTCSLRS